MADMIREMWVFGPQTEEARKIFEKLNKTEFVSMPNGEHCVLLKRMILRDDDDCLLWHNLCVGQAHQWEIIVT